MAEEDIERVEALDPLKASRIQNPDKVRDELGAPIWEEVKRSAYPPLKRIDLLRLADRPPHSVSLEAREQFAVVTFVGSGAPPVRSMAPKVARAQAMPHSVAGVDGPRHALVTVTAYH